MTPERLAAVKAYCTPCERDTADGIAHLVECLGDVAAEYRQGADAGVALALDRLIIAAGELRREIAR